MDEYQMEFATGFGESYQNCPACGAEMIPKQKECLSCGVVVQRFEDRATLLQTKNNIGGLEHLTSDSLKVLDKKWKQIVVNYHDNEMHQDFIKICQELQALPFAIYHYSKMLEIDKEDDIAQIMRRQVLSRMTLHMEPRQSKVAQPGPSLGATLLRWFNWVGICGSSACATAGILMPGAQNLVGLGMASLLIFVSLFVYRRSS